MSIKRRLSTVTNFSLGSRQPEMRSGDSWWNARGAERYIHIAQSSSHEYAVHGTQVSEQRNLLAVLVKCAIVRRYGRLMLVGDTVAHER